MRVLVSRKGFSLVELLTVIAIIAILASIIFPVMGMVGNKARQNKCLTQLHEIGVAVQMFKQDNRQYPDVLSEPVEIDPATSQPYDFTVKHAPQTPATRLYPEYVRSSLLFHCPMSKKTSTTEVDTDGATNTQFYPYDSYSYYRIDTSHVQQHYTKSWGTDPANLPVPGDAAPARDYERQLKFRNPPDDTVITWCSWHETGGGAGVNGKAPVLFLDGHADALPAGIVETQKWRVQPKKE